MSDGMTTPSIYFPVVLCYVSSHWRQIAFSTPQLWENLSTLVVLFGTPQHISPATHDLDKLLVRKKSIEFLTWWAANIKNIMKFTVVESSHWARPGFPLFSISFVALVTCICNVIPSHSPTTGAILTAHLWRQPYISPP